MLFRPFFLLQSIGSVINFVGEPVRGPAWFGGITTPTTISLRVTGFRGTISLEGSLIGRPQEIDWFTIPLDNLTFNVKTTQTFGWTMPLNVVVLRAKMDRTWMFTPPYFSQPPCEADLRHYGRIEWMLVNY